MANRKQQNGQLDMEWVILIREAKHLGLTITEIRKFLSNEYVSGFNKEKKGIFLKKAD
ncbi:anti-repressor SinI family protein [Oceanobacillus kapialis]|uniref:anti-repressor SinI family protein n=1 Tax=Oceanobacillus kapialis TaxID=481353 RepID=UPI00384FC685